MGLIIIVQTLLTCLIRGILINTYWFSYILFLTFLGGLLVLFIYVSSIASNEIFLINNIIIILLTFLMICLIFRIINYKNLNWLNLTNNEEINKTINFFIFFNNENKINLSKLYNNQTFILIIILIIYLFIALVAIVKITNIFYGPIRSNSY